MAGCEHHHQRIRGLERRRLQHSMHKGLRDAWPAQQSPAPQLAACLVILADQLVQPKQGLHVRVVTPVVPWMLQNKLSMHARVPVQPLTVMESPVGQEGVCLWPLAGQDKTAWGRTFLPRVALACKPNDAHTHSTPLASHTLPPSLTVHSQQQQVCRVAAQHKGRLCVGPAL